MTLSRRALITAIALILTRTAVARAQSTATIGGADHALADLHGSSSGEPSRVVRAGAAEPAVFPKPATRTEWYGLTTLAIDGAAIAVTGIGFAFPDPATGAVLVVSGIMTYALGAPVVHIAKGEYGSAAGSLALRVVIMLPILTLASVAPKSDAILMTLGAGAALAAGIDAAALAYRQVPVTPPARSWLNCVPTVAVGRDSASLVISGQF